MADLIKIRDEIVIPALSAINHYDKAGEQLVMGTGAAESGFKHTRQIAQYKPVLKYGPARGWFQMEPATHDDIWANWLGASSRSAILDGLRKITRRPGEVDELEKNQMYAAAMCRIFYLRVRAPLPAVNDWPAMAAYWKRYYNTHLGKGTVEGFLAKAKPVMGL